MAAGDRWLYGWGLGYVAVGGASLLVPVYALALGADAFVVGLLAATAAFAGVPGALLWGRLAERSGRRKPFVVFALLSAAVLLAAMPFVRESLPLLVLNAGLWFVVAAAAPVCNLVMVEDAAADDWDDRIGRLNAVQGYGWVAGLLLGTVWIAVPVTGAGAAAQRSLLFALAVVSFLATAVVGRWFDEPSSRVSPARFRDRFGRLQSRDLGAGRIVRLLPYGPGRIYWSLRRVGPAALRAELAGPLGLFFAGTTAFAVGSAVFWGPMPAYLDGRGLATETVFLVFLVGNLGSAVSYGRVAALEPVYGAVRLHLAAVGTRVGLFPGLVLVAGASVPALAGFLGLVGVSWALVAVTAPVLVSRLAPAGGRAAALATYTAISSAGTGLGSVLGGALAATYGFLAAYVLAGGLVLVGLGLAWRGLATRETGPVRRPGTEVEP